MKESLSVTSSQVQLDSRSSSSSSSNGDKLEMNGFNRVNVLFSGCTFVTIDSTITSTSSSTASSSSNQGIDSIPIPPDHGAIAYVLRTGFGSSQGTLLQMIEFSQQTVSGDSKETGMALLM